MTRNDAINWLNAQNGKGLDFDGVYGKQCVDFFNYYYQFLTGRGPYGDGYGVPGAKDLWNVPTTRFTKIANNPNDPNQLPKPGDILIYNSRWGGGYGHVEMVLAADANGVTVIGQNMKGTTDPVSTTTRTWGSVVSGLIGWLSFNGFSEVTIQPHQRIVAANGVNYRQKPFTSAPLISEFKSGDVLDFKGFVTGENVSGNDKWFVGAYTGGFAWSGAFTNPSTAGLPDITPVTITPPPTPEPPKYTFEKELACVTDVKPLGTQNFEYGNFPAKPEKAVIHDFGTPGVDTYESVINTVTQNGSRVSGPHFVVSGKTITQTASLKDRAYHAGAAGNNFVGIETDPAQDADTINSVRTLLTELKAYYGYQLALIEHNELMSTLCGDNVDLSKYDITEKPVEPPVEPEPPIDPPVEKPESLLDWVLKLINIIKDFLGSWKRK